MAGGKTLKMSTVRVRVPLSVLNALQVLLVALLPSKQADRVRVPSIALSFRT